MSDGCTTRTEIDNLRYDTGRDLRDVNKDTAALSRICDKLLGRIEGIERRLSQLIERSDNAM